MFQYEIVDGSLPHALTILCNSREVHDLLYYETGFEGLYPNREIYYWMDEHIGPMEIEWDYKILNSFYPFKNISESKNKNYSQFLFKTQDQAMKFKLVWG